MTDGRDAHRIGRHRLLSREHDVRFGELRDEMRILAAPNLLDAIAGETVLGGHS
jgi:hypothetical protein